jgi:hypothetical protein
VVFNRQDSTPPIYLLEILDRPLAAGLNILGFRVRGKNPHQSGPIPLSKLNPKSDLIRLQAHSIRIRMGEVVRHCNRMNPQISERP